MNKWIKKFMDEAYSWAEMSKDPSTQVGCVFVEMPVIGKAGHTLITGYNGLSKGSNDDPDKYQDRDYKHKHVIHAEENGIIYAASRGTPLKGSVLFVTHPPCSRCSAKLINLGIKAVIYSHDNGPSFPNRYWEKYGKDCEEAFQDMLNSGIEIYSDVSIK